MFALSTELQEDGFRIPQWNDIPGVHDGPKGLANIGKSLQNNADLETIIRTVSPEAWGGFLRFLLIAHANNSNVLLSSETFANPIISLRHLQSMFAAFGDAGCVAVVIVYRRFHEWLVSLYFEKFKALVHLSPIPSLVDWLTNASIHESWDADFTIRPSSVLKHFSQAYTNITVLNYHERDATLDETFFCNSKFPGFNHTCTKLRLQKNEPTNEQYNRGYSLEYARLAFLARARGLIQQTDDDMNKLSDLIMKHHEAHNNLVMKCLPLDHQTRLLKESQKEARLISTYTATSSSQTVAYDDEDLIDSEFAKYVKTNKLCTFDEDAAFRDPSWLTQLGH